MTIDKTTREILDGTKYRIQAMVPGHIKIVFWKDIDPDEDFEEIDFLADIVDDMERANDDPFVLLIPISKGIKVVRQRQIDEMEAEEKLREEKADG